MAALILASGPFLDESPPIEQVCYRLPHAEGKVRWVGRSTGVSFRIPDAAISEKHFAICRQSDGSYIIQDENSTNGTYIRTAQDWEKLSIGTIRHLVNRDEIKVGDSILLFVEEDVPLDRDEGDRAIRQIMGLRSGVSCWLPILPGETTPRE
jgi:hypothetical protein